MKIVSENRFSGKTYFIQSPPDCIDEEDEEAPELKTPTADNQHGLIPSAAAASNQAVTVTKVKKVQRGELNYWGMYKAKGKYRPGKYRPAATWAMQNRHLI